MNQVGNHLRGNSLQERVRLPLHGTECLTNEEEESLTKGDDDS